MKTADRKRSFLLGSFLLLSSLGLSGYVVNTLTNSEHPVWRPNSFPVRMQIWEGFTDDLPNIVDGSNPKLALREALERWARTSSLTVILGPDTATSEVGQDGINLITIADTEQNRDVVGQAAGVSLSLIDLFTASLIETDVVLNPADTWSTIETEDFDVVDLMAVALHEFGHSWNLNHTVERSSVMHFREGGFDFGFNQLAWDDIAGINISYPLVGLAEITGAISGRVTRGEDSVFGAFVVAVDEHGVLAASTITGPDGTYRLEFLPPGDYLLYVEPLDGPTTPANITGGLFSSAPMVTDFLPKFYNDSMEPNVTVVSGETGTDFNFAVTQGNATLNPMFLGTSPSVFSASLFTAAAEASQGRNTHYVLGGQGVETLLDDRGVFFAGPHLATAPVAQTFDTEDGLTLKWYPLTVPLDAPKGEYSVFLQGNPELGVISGGLKLFSRWRFLQAFAQFAHVTGAATSGVFLVNADLARGATGKISARSGAGGRTAIALGNLGLDAHNDLDLALNPGGSFSARTGGAAAFIGSLRAEADRSIGGTVLFETQDGTTGVGASEPLYSFIAPIEISGGGINTGLALTVLEERPAQVYIQVQDRDGGFVAHTIRELEGNGHLAQFIREMGELTAVPSDFAGTVVVTANRKIGATVIRTSPGVFTTFPVVQNRVSPRSFYAQFAHAEDLDLTSTLLLVNPSPLRPASVTAQVRSSDGSAASVTLNEEPLPTGRKDVVIPPLGMASLETGGAGVLVGSVEVTSEIPVGGVVLFSSPETGTAGVGESFPTRKVVILIERDTGAGADTGIAAVNTENRAVTMTVTVRGPEGNVVSGPREIGLEALGQLARFPNEAPLELNLDATFVGSAWIEVDGDVAFTVIRQGPGILTTFPAKSLEEFITPAG